jgi:hypothetical protein
MGKIQDYKSTFYNCAWPYYNTKWFSLYSFLSSCFYYQRLWVDNNNRMSNKIPDIWYRKSRNTNNLEHPTILSRKLCFINFVPVGVEIWLKGESASKFWSSTVVALIFDGLLLLVLLKNWFFINNTYISYSSFFQSGQKFTQEMTAN